MGQTPETEWLGLEVPGRCDVVKCGSDNKQLDRKLDRKEETRQKSLENNNNNLIIAIFPHRNQAALSLVLL